jgi:hypothetical protein
MLFVIFAFGCREREGGDGEDQGMNLLNLAIMVDMQTTPLVESLSCCYESASSLFLLGIFYSGSCLSIPMKHIAAIQQMRGLHISNKSAHHTTIPTSARRLKYT